MGLKMKKDNLTTEQWLKFIGLDKLQTFQDYFSKNFGGSMCFYDIQGKPLTVCSRESLFCLAVQKDNLKRCQETAAAAIASLPETPTRISACPFGVTCIYCTVFFNDHPIAYAYYGGITTPDSRIPEALRLKYSLPVLTREQIEDLAKLLDSALKLLNVDYSAFTPFKSAAATNLPYNLRDERISNREWEIVELLCRGMTNKQIAASLFISETTVKTHVSNILAKLDLHDRMQIIVRYYGKFDRANQSETDTPHA
jgi:DNA-binding CsgD family transcriptional regulator